MNDPAIARFDVLPDYGRGFVFHWRMRGGFNDPSPWEFRIQMAPTQEGEWKDVSPVIVDSMSYKSKGSLRVNKSDILFFRLFCHTPRGDYFTEARTPYGDLSRSEFLLAREVMRKEVLHMRGMAGVECDVWSVSNFGPRCMHCLDPVTGHTRDSHCKFCFGTGFYPAYRGPFRVWCMFSENNQHKVSEGNEGNGVDEEKRFSVRMVSSIPTKKNDILHDVRSGKRYYVGASEVAAELRRVPIVQTLDVSEIATSDAAYSVGVRHGA
jgi:hypothetical protein